MKENPKQEIRQFVMAYGVEHDRVRALLPDGFTSLRPVLRINAEIRNDKELYLELNTPVSANSFHGWLNIGRWNSECDPLSLRTDADNYVFELPFLSITFKPVGITGGCPAEKDNDGCMFLTEEGYITVAAKSIEANKEFCDCSFAWHFTDTDAHGVSIGKTLPASPTPIKKTYQRKPLTVQNAASIPCTQVLGAYTVYFIR